ncbi:MAG: hypothetical protein ACT4PJ_10415 [Gemmatimonadaceae bacterium]
MKTLTSRSIPRAATVTVAALTFAACSDSTAPLDVSPEQLQAIGEVLSTEIQSGVQQLTAPAAMGSVGAPSFSVQRRTFGNVGGLSLSVQRSAHTMPRLQVVDTECGVPSQNPPTDTDQDQIPDNLSITFSLPACRFVEQNGSFDLTGVMRITDTQPGTAGMAFNLALDNFRLTFDTPDLDGFVRRDGLTTVAASANGLVQTVSWLESAQLEGLPTIGADIDWSASFASLGGSITPGMPLPDGVYLVNGTFEYRQAGRSASFSIATVDELIYSAACAAGVAQGTMASPFTSGTVRIAGRNDGDRGYAQVTFADCAIATVVFVAS